MAKSEIKVCGLQMAIHLTVNPQSRDIEKNIKRARGLIKSCSLKEPDLTVLPEFVFTGPTSVIPDIKKVAETVPGPITKMFGKEAEEYNTHIVLNMFEEEEENYYSTAVLIGRNGGLMGKYRKVHLFPLEQPSLRHGTEYKVIDTDIGKIGLMVCYDLYFPEASRSLALGGAQVIVVPSMTLEKLLYSFKYFTICRAMENQVFVISLNSVGVHPGLGERLPGGTVMAGPNGQILDGGEEEKIIVANLNIDEIDDSRKRLNYINSRVLRAYNLGNDRR